MVAWYKTASEACKQLAENFVFYRETGNGKPIFIDRAHEIVNHYFWQLIGHHFLPKMDEKVSKAAMQLASFDEAKQACREIKNQLATKPKHAFNESCCNEYGCMVFAFVYTAVHQMKLWAPVPPLAFKSNLSCGRSKDASKTTLETPLGEPVDASMLSHFKRGTDTASSYWITYYYLNPNEPS